MKQIKHTFEEKKEGDTFTVGFDQDFPPMGFVGDDGEYTGFDLELAKEVCDRNGWEFNPEPIAWDSKDALLKSGEIDCIWNGFTMNGREDEYTWSEPYLDNQQVFVVRADSGINSEKDLAGKTVDVQTDSSAEAALKDNTELSSTFSTEIIPDYNTGFMNLESGAVDAVAMDIVVAKYQIESRSAEFKILDYEIASEQYGVGFAKGNDAYVAAAVEKYGLTLSQIDKLSWSSFFASNLVPVTLGNIVGGAFVAMMYWLVFLKEKND